MSEINFTTDKIKVCEFANQNGLYDIMTVDGFVVASDAMLQRANQIVKCVNEHDSLVARAEKVEAELLEQRQELDNNNDLLREIDNARVVAEAEVERLQKYERNPLFVILTQQNYNTMKDTIDMLYEYKKKYYEVKHYKVLNKKAKTEVDQLRKQIYNIKDNGYNPSCECVRCTGIREAIETVKDGEGL